MDNIYLKSNNNEYKNVRLVFQDCIEYTPHNCSYNVAVNYSNWSSLMYFIVTLNTDRQFLNISISNTYGDIQISDPSNLNFLVNLLNEVVELDWEELTNRFVAYMDGLEDDEEEEEDDDEDGSDEEDINLC